jgi:hypothetical protein
MGKFFRLRLASQPRAENPATAALREDAPGMARSGEIVRPAYEAPTMNCAIAQTPASDASCYPYVSPVKTSKCASAV